jgi:hypothetical protein
MLGSSGSASALRKTMARKEKVEKGVEAMPDLGHLREGGFSILLD